MNKTVIRNLLTGAWALLFAFATAAFGQGVTSSNISGIVSDAAGKPISGAIVTVVYAPTNSTTTTTTNTAGRYSFTGLRVGGPYVVSATANGEKSNERTDINLDLSQTFQADLSVGTEAEIVKMEAFVTHADSNVLFDSFVTGSGTDLSQARIDAVPTIARALNEYAKLDPRIVITDRSNGETSALGQNGRYNSIMIDGIRSNDTFGLTSNGLPSQSNPISIDTIEAFNIETSPYDVAQSGFTGAAINAVTKSGTNEYHGMIKYLWTNQRIRAKNEDPTNINYGKREVFSENTMVATLGGPIIKDKLFFFGSYETFKRLDPVTNPGFQPTDAAVQTIVTALKAYNYDPGVLTNSGNAEKKDHKVLAKIDWNISDAQRLSVRYNKTKGTQPIFQDFSSTSAISFSNHWYTNQQIDTNYVATLFSNWTPNFKTETKVAFSTYQTDRSPNGPAFPQIVIAGVPSTAGGTATGYAFVGWENSTQLNHLLVKDNNYTFTGTYLLDNHTISFGVDYEYNHFYNAFAQGVDGTYGTSATTSLYGFNYSALSASGISGGTLNYTYQYSPTGGSLAADWKYTNPALFLQDQWHVNSRLTVTAGLRLDTFTSDKPGYNAALSNYAWPMLGGQTVSNTNSIDGSKNLAPRVSFNLALDEDRTTQLRGGIGVFQGKGPGVWLSNNFSNNGLLIAQATKATLATNGITTITFQPDPTKQIYSPSQPTYAVNLMQNGFKLPSALKGNLSVDRKLPWMGLIATLSYDQTKNMENYYYEDINLKPIGTLPDGRTLYGGNGNRVNPSFTNVFLMKDTKKGNAYNYTAELKKPYKNHWFGTVSYTYGRATDVSPITSSTAGSNFGARMATDSNSEELATSNYQVKHRFSASVSRDFNYFKGFKTTLGFYYEARSGRPYSYVFSSDINGDAANQNNDLFYVPTGPSDPKVRFTTQAQSDAFFAWLNGVSDLKKYAGSIVPRNSATSKWIHQLDFNLRQEIPIWGNVKAELFYDIYNLTNLLNSHWGRYTQIGFPYNYFVSAATYDPVANQYVYNFTGTPRGQTLDNTLSRWQMQAGVSLKF